jgi:hypothetical protein
MAGQFSGPLQIRTRAALLLCMPYAYDCIGFFLPESRQPSRDLYGTYIHVSVHEYTEQLGGLVYYRRPRPRFDRTGHASSTADWTLDSPRCLPKETGTPAGTGNANVDLVATSERAAAPQRRATPRAPLRLAHPLPSPRQSTKVVTCTRLRPLRFPRRARALTRTTSLTTSRRRRQPSTRASTSTSSRSVRSSHASL